MKIIVAVQGSPKPLNLTGVPGGEAVAWTRDVLAGCEAHVIDPEGAVTFVVSSGVQLITLAPENDGDHEVVNQLRIEDAEAHNVVITIRKGVLEDVENLPVGWTYTLLDYDICTDCGGQGCVHCEEQAGAVDE